MEQTTEKKAIEEILRKNQLIPSYPFLKKHHKVYRDFIVKWTYYYTTPATMKGKKVFLKVLLQKERYHDFLSQISFHKYLIKQNLTVFKFPKIFIADTKPIPYAIFSYVDGQILGHLDGTRSKYGTKETVFNMYKGIKELQNKIPTFAQPTLKLWPASKASAGKQNWQKVKDFPWFYSLIEALEERLQNSPYVSRAEVSEIVPLIKKIEPLIKFDYVPLLGDLSPSNIILQKKSIFIFDQAPFTIGNPLSDLAEFLSYGLVTKSWQKQMRELDITKGKELLLLTNLLVFVVNRMVNQLELMKLFGKKKKYINNISTLRKAKVEIQTKLIALVGGTL